MVNRVGVLVVFGGIEAEMEDAKSKPARFMIDMQDCGDTWARKCLCSKFTDRGIVVH